MPKNKSKRAKQSKQSTQQGISWKRAGAILVSLATLVGMIVSGLDFINYLREGYQQFLWLGLTVLAIIWLIILWLLFKQRNVYGVLWLAVTILGGVVIWNGWHSYVQTREDKLIVLIAKFDDTQGDFYELRDEIFDALTQTFGNDTEIQIEKVDEVITEDKFSGSPLARNWGKRYQADLVIWGSYRKTENPNMKIHVENMTLESLLLAFKESETIKPSATIADLESFTFQQQAGQGASALISLLAGFIRYFNEDYETAIDYYDKSLASLSAESQIFVSIADLYFYRGNAKYFIHNNQGAVQDYEHAIEINPQFREAFVSRGAAYAGLGDYQQALQDFNRAIEIDPNYAKAYNNRGATFAQQEQYQAAIEDFDKAIEINPVYVNAYFNRGIAKMILHKFDQAIQDYDKVISLRPFDSEAYMFRGACRNVLNQPERAIPDFNKALRLGINIPEIYVFRGYAYKAVGNIVASEADFKKYEELTGEKP